MLPLHALPSQSFLAALLSKLGHTVNMNTLGGLLNEALRESCKDLPNSGMSTTSFNWKTTMLTCRRGSGRSGGELAQTASAASGVARGAIGATGRACSCTHLDVHAHGRDAALDATVLARLGR